MSNMNLINDPYIIDIICNESATILVCARVPIKRFHLCGVRYKLVRMLLDRILFFTFFVIYICCLSVRGITAVVGFRHERKCICVRIPA